MSELGDALKALMLAPGPSAAGAVDGPELTAFCEAFAAWIITAGSGSGLPPPAADGSILASAFGAWFEYMAGAEGDVLTMVSGNPTWQPAFRSSGSGTLLTDSEDPVDTSLVFSVPADSAVEIGFRAYGRVQTGETIALDGIFRGVRKGTGDVEPSGLVGKSPTDTSLGAYVAFDCTGADVTMQIAGIAITNIQWAFEWWVSTSALPSAPAAWDLPPGYDPSTEGTCVLWVSPRDPSSFTVNGSNQLTGVTNKVSSTAFTTIFGTPDYEPTGLNGFPCFNFAAGEAIQTTEAAVVNASNQPLAVHVFFVGSVSSVTDAYRFACAWSISTTLQSRLGFGTTTAGTGRWGVIVDTNSDALIERSQASGNYATGPHSHMWEIINGFVKHVVDGVLDFLDNSGMPTGAMTPNVFTIGDIHQNNVTSLNQAAWNGKLGDMLVYVGPLSSAAQSRIQVYLDREYSL